MKKFLVVGTDGVYYEVSETTGKSAKDVREELLRDLAEDSGGADWYPTSYEIYEYVGTPTEVDDEAVERSAEVREKRLRERYARQREDNERREYERLKKRFG